jgi:DHA1 family bicyclomycin/chloramphenicol resistance-like MFS transporter
MSKDKKISLGFREFVAMMAYIMALGALSIDSMLPALPQIGSSLGVENPNNRQFVVTAFVAGFGIAQFFVGMLSDMLGRRVLMLVSLAAFILFSLLSTLAPTFELLIAARVAQGAAAAGARVLVTSIVRDQYAGRQMARVMSLAFMVFLAAPVLAPALGQLILLVGPWRWIFAFLSVLGMILFIWAAWRLPETLPVSDRLPLTWTQIRKNMHIVLSDRMSTGYTLASGLLFGGLLGFIGSVQQMLTDVFGAEKWLGAVFAIVSAAMAIGSWFNARYVEKIGMRKIGHTALIGYILVTAIHAFAGFSGTESLILFIVMQSGMMLCFSLTGGNFGAMAMEKMGSVAGMASSLQGFASTMLAAAVGMLIGQQFNGSVTPIYAGCCLAGITALVIVLATEHGRLFVPLQPRDADTGSI